MSKKGLIFDIQHYAVHDGPGIRTSIFLQGCPLRCLWCANPESQEPHPQIKHNPSKCQLCYNCLQACPKNAITVDRETGSFLINRQLCKTCEDYSCEKKCYYKALQVVGKYYTADEVINDVNRDFLFYLNSNGGITLSGGEPTYQPAFVLQILKESQKRGLHTVVSTCGYTSPEIIKEIAPYVNLFLYDIKHIDPQLHRKFTGVDNKLILKNAEDIVHKYKTPISFRVPIIPYYNDSAENLQEITNFVRHLNISEVTIIPYHQMGIPKYSQLGLAYKISSDTKPPSEIYLKEIRDVFSKRQVICRN